MSENNVVKVFYGEEEQAEFRELESLLREARPEFASGWESAMAARIAAEKKSSRFFLRSAAAAALLVMALVTAVFFGGGPIARGGVSETALSHVLGSVGGNSEPGLDDILSGWENGWSEKGLNYDDYIEDTLGGGDEENIS